MKNYEKLKSIIVKEIPEIVINENAQLIKFDHSVEYFKQTRPITLEDIVIVLGEDYYVGNGGYFYRIECDINDGETQEIRMLEPGIQWQFNKPLHKQSEETIDFLLEILDK